MERAVRHVCHCISDRPDAINRKAVDDLEDIAHRGYRHKRERGENYQRAAAYGYPRHELAALAYADIIDHSAYQRIVYSVPYFADNDYPSPVAEPESDILGIEQHEIVRYQRKAHIAAEIAHRIAEIILHTEWSCFVLCSHDTNILSQDIFLVNYNIRAYRKSIFKIYFTVKF